MALFREDFYPGYVMQDVGTLVFFILCLVVAQRYAAELATYRTLVWFAAGYSLIALFAYAAAELVLRPEYWWNGRWDPPYYPVFGALALLVRYGNSMRHRVVSAVVMLPMFWLAFASGNRTQFLLGVICALIIWGTQVVFTWAAVTVVTMAVLLNSMGLLSFVRLASAVQDSRFSSLQGGADTSLAGRFSETSDVLTRIRYDNAALQTIFGRGHGAVWEPITRRLEGLPSEVFYIHNGPTALGWRYGVIGLVLFAYFGWVAIRAGLLAAGRKATPPEKMWLLGALGFFVNYFFQNSLFDPPAVLAMAVSIRLVREIRQRDARTPSEDEQLSDLGTNRNPIARGIRPLASRQAFRQFQ